MALRKESSMIKFTIYFNNFDDMKNFIAYIVYPDFRGHIEYDQYMSIEDPFKVYIAVPVDECNRVLLKIWDVSTQVQDFVRVEENGKKYSCAISSKEYKNLIARHL